MLCESLEICFMFIGYKFEGLVYLNKSYLIVVERESLDVHFH